MLERRLSRHRTRSLTTKQHSLASDLRWIDGHASLALEGSGWIDFHVEEEDGSVQFEMTIAVDENQDRERDSHQEVESMGARDQN